MRPGTGNALGSVLSFTAMAVITVGSAPGAVAASSVSPTTFGAIGDGVHDDWSGFQQAIDAVARTPGGGTVQVPAPPANGFWRLSQALRMRSHVAVNIAGADSRIVCGGAPGSALPGYGGPGSISWPLNGCVVFGSYTPNNIGRAPTLTAGALAKGSTTLNVQPEQDGAALLEGDVVAIETTDSFRIGKGDNSYKVPFHLELAIVSGVEASGSTVRLSKPLGSTYDSARVRRLTNTGSTMMTNVDTREPLWATVNASVTGGNWEVADLKTQPFTAGGGAIDCKMNLRSVKAYTGAGYGNLYTGCDVKVANETISGIALEYGYGSYHNSVNLGAVNVDSGKAANAAPWIFGFGEGSYGNSVSVSTVNVEAPAHNVVLLNRSSGNTVNIGSLRGMRIDGFGVKVLESAFVGHSPPTERNTVTISAASLDGMRGKVDKGTTSNNSLSVP